MNSYKISFQLNALKLEEMSKNKSNTKHFEALLFLKRQRS